MLKRIGVAIVLTLGLLCFEVSTSIHALSSWPVEVEVPIDAGISAESSEIAVLYSPTFDDYFEPVRDLRIERDTASFSVDMQYCDSRGLIGRTLGGPSRPHPSMYRIRIVIGDSPPVDIAASDGELSEVQSPDSRSRYRLSMPALGAG